MTRIVRKFASLAACWFATCASPIGNASQPNGKPPAPPAPESPEARAKETRNLGWGYRHRRMFRADLWEDAYIGGLVENGVWHKDLPLVATQAAAIKKLDALLLEANDQATLRAAEYIDTNPLDYRDFNARLNRRLNETLRHAERMVSLGLLTEAQAAKFLQLRISGSGS